MVHHETGKPSLFNLTTRLRFLRDAQLICICLFGHPELDAKINSAARPKTMACRLFPLCSAVCRRVPVSWYPEESGWRDSVQMQSQLWQTKLESCGGIQESLPDTPTEPGLGSNVNVQINLQFVLPKGHGLGIERRFQF